MIRLSKPLPLFIFLFFLPLLLAAHDVSDADQEILSNGGLLSYILTWASKLMNT